MNDLKCFSSKITLLFFTLAMLAVLSPATHAATVSLNPTKDNSIYEENGTISNGLGALYSGRTNGTGGTLSRRALVSFDISAIPAGSTIDNVSLKLQVIQFSDLSSRTMSLHLLTSDWGEATSSGGGQGGLAVANDATWTANFFQSSTWNTAGGDFVSAESATQTIAGTGSYSWTSATLISDTQNWLDGNADNFGWILIGDEANTRSTKVFASREHSNTNFQPRLTIEFTAVPEPPAALLCILGFGSIIMFRITN